MSSTRFRHDSGSSILDANRPASECSVLNAFFTAPLRHRSSRGQSLGQTNGPGYASSSLHPCSIFCISRISCITICESYPVESEHLGTGRYGLSICRPPSVGLAQIPAPAQPFSRSESDMDHTTCRLRTAESSGTAETLVYDMQHASWIILSRHLGLQPKDNELCIPQSEIFKRNAEKGTRK